MMNRKRIFVLVLALLLQFYFSMVAMATVLPDPTSTVDGLPVARQFDEFVSYSTQLLTQFGFTGFSGAAGVGGLDVVLLTQAGGIKNNPVAGGFVFEDPASSATGGTSTFSGTWGQGDRARGPVLVDTVLDYLHHQFGPNNNIPVFTFDLVEPGSAATRDLQMVANFIVYNPITHTEVASWSIDSTNNSLFDVTSFITVEGEIQLTGTSGHVYQADNTGSGKYDFLVYAPTMDLSLYAGQGYEFHIFSSFRDLDGSGEESFISGAFTTQTHNPPGVPEPSTLITAGLGLIGAFAPRFRRTTK